MRRPYLLDAAAVNNVLDSGNCQRSFGDVRRHDDQSRSFGRRLKDTHLLTGRKHRVQRQHLHWWVRV